MLPRQVFKSTRPYDLVRTRSSRLIADQALQLGRTAEVQHFSIDPLRSPRAHQPAEPLLALARQLDLDRHKPLLGPHRQVG